MRVDLHVLTESLVRLGARVTNVIVLLVKVISLSKVLKLWFFYENINLWFSFWLFMLLTKSTEESLE